MPFCPNCKYEYRPGIQECPDCGAKLVDKLPEEKKPAIIDAELVAVASYPYEIDAQEARLKLESYGVESVLMNEKISQTDVILAWAQGGVHVMVRGEDADAARKILEDEQSESEEPIS